MQLDLEALFTLSPNSYVVFDRDWTIVWMNQAYLNATMRTRAEITGRNVFEAFPSDPDSESYALLRASFDRVLETRTVDEIALIPYDIAAPDGSRQERFWSATHTPLLDDAGEVAFILQHTVDVTELHGLRRMRDEIGVVRRAIAVQERNSALQAQRERLTRYFQEAPGFMAVLGGPDHRFELANSAYQKLVAHRAVVGMAVADALPEVVEQGFVAILDEVRRSGRPYFGRALEVHLAVDEAGPGEEPRLERRYVDLVYQPILEADAVTGIFVQGHDVTHGVEAQAHQDLLINELHHRVKNTLAIVQSLATQTFRGIDGAREARRAFDARLQALARAHDLLTERNWQETPLGAVIAQTVRAAAGDAAARIAIDGPEVLLSPRLSVTMAMTLHELTTNAIKYGALANEDGRIAVAWSLSEEDEPMLRATWCESGGPRVEAPAHRGFGMRLIELGIAAEPHGKVTLDFAPEGLAATLELRLVRPRAPG
ncbi:PAS domain-containing protein [Novosphingobium sp. 1949]|uniref:histidine kinase n=1 Tax=Novosphingobium organovorum TaxID=2930092 RepID=A0ABT0BGY8_9SPHN|nr:HWE histidine kinase domain-containing protein [Novosphingobium organovorum]MCJ2184332.1 PAS domain-containing protein [Novosphingobium organovorum]